LFGLSGTIGQVADLGGACGAGRAPRLTARGVPRPGNGDFALELQGGANAPFAIGWSAASRPTPLGAGCTLLLDAPMCAVFGITASTGLGDVPLSIPAALGLRGLPFVLQGAVLDPLSPIGSWFSQGLRVAVGD